MYSIHLIPSLVQSSLSRLLCCVVHKVGFIIDGERQTSVVGCCGCHGGRSGERCMYRRHPVHILGATIIHVMQSLQFPTRPVSTCSFFSYWCDVCVALRIYVFMANVYSSGRRRRNRPSLHSRVILIHRFHRQHHQRKRGRNAPRQAQSSIPANMLLYLISCSWSALVITYSNALLFYRPAYAFAYVFYCKALPQLTRFLGFFGHHGT